MPDPPGLLEGFSLPNVLCNDAPLPDALKPNSCKARSQFLAEVAIGRQRGVEVHLPIAVCSQWRTAALGRATGNTPGLATSSRISPRLLRHSLRIGAWRRATRNAAHPQATFAALAAASRPSRHCAERHSSCSTGHGFSLHRRGKQ